MSAEPRCQASGCGETRNIQHARMGGAIVIHCDTCGNTTTMVPTASEQLTSVLQTVQDVESIVRGDKD